MARRIVAGSGAGSKVLGVGKLRRTLKALPGGLNREVKKTIRDGAEEVRFSMLGRVKVGTGALADGIRAKTSSDGLSAKVGFFGKRVMKKVGWRAHFIEFGTGPGTYKRGKRKGKSFKATPAQPFMVPAMREKAGQIKRDIDRAVGRALERAGRVRL